MTRRLPKLARWLAGIYLVWSLLVFFGSLFGSSHEWWPMFLYPTIWPLGALHALLSDACLDWFFPEARSVPGWAYTLNDYTAGAFYIVVGTIWVWCLGRVFSIVATRIFPLRHDNTVA
jgi:hypothetical protein